MNPLQQQAVIEQGEWIRSKRKAMDFGMREFAMLIEELPSNWCNVENGRRELPKSEEKLRLIAKVLGIREHSEEWETLFGFVARPVRLPLEIGQAIEIEHVPTLLRTINDKRLSPAEVQKVIEFVEKELRRAKRNEKPRR